MNKQEVERLMDRAALPGIQRNASMVETHISWIILSEEYAYKIKRPMKFSFLDFSTLEKRKYYCDRELELNRRTAPDMYLEVMPVMEKMLGGEGDNRVFDYALKMKRMDNDLELEKLLSEDKICGADLVKLADTVARFHQHAPVVKDAFDTTGFQQKYSDINSVAGTISEYLGKEIWNVVSVCIERSNEFLNTHRKYFNQRVISGYHRDVHGDLKASNIFMYDEPVIFDCIEFNDNYRQIDVLNDIAFLCVDLDYHSSSLGDFFYQSYKSAWGAGGGEDSRKLWIYYKSYRANVLAKIATIKISETDQSPMDAQTVKRYIDLMQQYSECL